MLPQVDAQSAAAALGENGEIAASLRCLDYTEGELLPWDGKILGVVASNLQENAAIGPPL